jgi:hypothetical protein
VAADVVVTVIDHTGVVEAAASHVFGPDDFTPEFVDSGPMINWRPPGVMLVAWLGRTCETRPSVVLSGDTTKLTISVFTGLAPDVSCGGMRITRSIELYPVPEDVVGASYHEGTP